jgi:hypothetical protein
MKGKAIELIVQQTNSRKSKTADGYTLQDTVELHGAFETLTLKLRVLGEPDEIKKALKSLKISDVDNKATMKLHVHKNPQTRGGVSPSPLFFR